MPEKLFSSAGWQPAEALYVPKKLVSSAGWQPAEALCGGKSSFRLRGWQPAEALDVPEKPHFVCGLAARTA